MFDASRDEALFEQAADGFPPVETQGVGPRGEAEQPFGAGGAQPLEFTRQGVAGEAPVPSRGGPGAGRQIGRWRCRHRARVAIERA